MGEGEVSVAYLDYYNFELRLSPSVDRSSHPETELSTEVGFFIGLPLNTWTEFEIKPKKTQWSIHTAVRL